MSSKKNRDVAQELVDFLLKDEEQKTKIAGQVSDKKTIPKPAPKPALVPPAIPSSAIPPAVPKAAPKPESQSQPPSLKPWEKPPVPNLKPDLKQVGKPVPPPETKIDFGFDPQKETQLGLTEKLPPLGLKVDEATQPTRNQKIDSVEFLMPDPEPEPELAPQPTTSAVADTTRRVSETSVQDENPFEEKKKAQPAPADIFNSQRSKIIFNEVSSLMAGVEAVKVAQARINVLEKEKTKLRDEIDQVLLASEALQRQLNEFKAEHDSLERRYKEKIEIMEDEKAVMRSRSKAKEDELGKIKKENDELKDRFQSDLRRIRVRERELETRQEIMKAENQSVLRAKDELIIELKRQLEKLHFELDNFRSQSADLNSKVSEFHDRNHRTVKALRLALSVLEAGDGDDKKKVGS